LSRHDLTQIAANEALGRRMRQNTYDPIIKLPNLYRIRHRFDSQFSAIGNGLIFVFS
jgi:hypothetical protein